MFSASAPRSSASRWRVSSLRRSSARRSRRRAATSNACSRSTRWNRSNGMATSPLHELSEQGVSVWFDTLSRDLLETGELERMTREDAVVGVTSNPTIFQKALAEGDRYDAQLREVAERESDPKEVFFALAVDDIKAA